MVTRSLTRWAEENQTKCVAMFEQTVQLAHILTVSLIQIQNCFFWRSVMCRSQGKFSWSTNFPNYIMAVSEVSFILTPEPDLMQLWTLQNTVCAFCRIEYVKIPSPFTGHFHLGLWCLVWKNCSLPGLLWISDACWLQMKLWVWKPLGKKLTYSTLVLFHGVTLVLILQFLLSFALSGVNRANIDGQVQQRCLPKTSRRHDWCSDTNS